MRDFFLLFNKKAIKETYGIFISDFFLDCADLQLKVNFEKQTGIKPKQGKIAITIFDVPEFNYLKGNISKMDISVIIIASSSFAKICWQSKSGRIYEPADENINCNNIQFWFEGLDPTLYYKQLYPNDPLPFKIKKAYFPIEINRLTITLLLSVYFTESTSQSRQIVIDKVGEIINNWNLKMEKEDALKISKGLEDFDSKGVVHNYSIVKNEENHLGILIDLGSADAMVIKRIITLFTKEPKIAKLIID